MGDTKATTESVFARIFEIQINQATALPVSPALFYEIQGTLVLDEEVFVKGIEETGIVLVLDLPGALDGAHSRDGVVPCTASYMAMRPKKGIQRPITLYSLGLLLCFYHKRTITRNRFGDGHV